MRYLLLLLGAVSTVALAGTATVNWTNPTTYVDGTAIAAGDITQTRIAYGSCNGTAFGTQAGQAIASGTATSLAIPNLPPGTYCFEAFTTALGVESAASNAVTATIAQPAPKPPVLTTVSLTAFAPQRLLGLEFAFAVGTVPLHTACGTLLRTVNQGTLYSVPVSAVTAKRVPTVAYAHCG